MRQTFFHVSLLAIRYAINYANESLSFSLGSVPNADKLQSQPDTDVDVDADADSDAGATDTDAGKATVGGQGKSDFACI